MRLMDPAPLLFSNFIHIPVLSSSNLEREAGKQFQIKQINRKTKHDQLLDLQKNLKFSLPANLQKR
jgi:hypothetical protein